MVCSRQISNLHPPLLDQTGRKKTGCWGGESTTNTPGLIKKKRVPAAPWYYHGKTQNHTRHCLIRLGGTKNRLGGGEIDNQYPGLLFEEKKRGPAAPGYSHDTPQNYTLHCLARLGGSKQGWGGNRQPTPWTHKKNWVPAAPWYCHGKPQNHTRHCLIRLGGTKNRLGGGNRQPIVRIRPRKACRYPNLRSFGWVSYAKVGGLYSGKLGIRSEARASDLRSYPGLWWKRINLRPYEGYESEYSPRTCSIGRPAGGTLCPPPLI